MGSLVLQVGQCGNQIGLKLWDELRAMHNSTNDFLFRDGDQVTHSIMVDTEPKVLRMIKQDRGTYFYYDPNNVIYYQSGRGNNWAMGYHNVRAGHKKGKDFETMQKIGDMPTLEKAQFLYKLKTQGKNKTNMDKELDSDEAIMKENTVLLEQVNNMIQKEVERIDYYTSTMLIYSLAGGTGSGFGSRILETLKDEYTANLLYNTVVFPSISGENPLQQYNCVLSLSHLQEFSDGIIYFQNDKVYKCLSRLGGANENAKAVNIDDINDYIASLLANLLKVNDFKSPKRFYSDYLSDLTCLNECKFLEFYGSPFNLRGNSTLGLESSWESVIDQCFLQAGIENEQIDSKSLQAPPVNHNTLAAKCIMRSNDVDTAFMKNETIKKYLDRKVQGVLHPLKWNPDAMSYEFIKEKIKSVGDIRGMMVLANRMHIADILKELLEISRSKYKAKAYLHWYYKYGMEEEDFLKAFENIEMIIDNYKYMLN